MHNKISTPLKNLADAEVTQLEKLVAIIHAMVLLPTKVAGYSGTPAGSMNEYVEGGKLFESGVLLPGTWDGFSFTGWASIANQVEVIVTSINSGALQCLRIEDMAGKAYFEADVGEYAETPLFDLVFGSTTIEAGTQYRIPPFLLCWGFTT